MAETEESEVHGEPGVPGIRTVGTAGAVGAAGGYGLQVLGGNLVPWAMSTFGTVVPGVGTIHASGGVAATLQAFAATSTLPVAIVSGAIGILGYNFWQTGRVPLQQTGDMQNDVVEKTQEIPPEENEVHGEPGVPGIRTVGTAGAVGAAGGYGLQVLGGNLVPWAMSTFGTVVPGVGTIHASGGVAATLQAFAATSTLPVAIVSGAIGILGYNFWQTGRQEVPPPLQQTGDTQNDVVEKTQEIPLSRL